MFVIQDLDFLTYLEIANRKIISADVLCDFFHLSPRGIKWTNELGEEYTKEYTKKNPKNLTAILPIFLMIMFFVYNYVISKP